jgi:hypothetical protein
MQIIEFLRNFITKGLEIRSCFIIFFLDFFQILKLKIFTFSIFQYFKFEKTLNFEFKKLLNFEPAPKG